MSSYTVIAGAAMPSIVKKEKCDMSPIPPPFHNDFPNVNPETLQKLSPEH